MATLRQQITTLLEGASLSALDISKVVGVSEKEVYRHLAHIAKSVAGRGRRLTFTPCTCQACGFTFKTRQRLTRPSRCPRCRQTRIDHPVFRVV